MSLFFPAVFVNVACEQQNLKLAKDSLPEIDSKVTPGKAGVTHELCAGIIDKDISPVEIARQEVLEEVGYDVPVERLEKIMTGR